jgi:5-(carboxyamino)imidazole ribonucleotide synthase
LELAHDPPARALGEVVRHGYEDIAQARSFARGLDVVTYEFENVPVRMVRALAEEVRVFPPPEALEMAQDRLTEKAGFHALGIPTAPVLPVDSRSGLEAALAELGYPAVLKTRRMGYDGKGQVVLRAPADVEDAWARLGTAPLLLEGWVAFERELSILGVRSVSGEARFYPLISTHHEAGILDLAHAPASAGDGLQAEAEGYARVLMEHLDYVGVLALELFDTGHGLLANEMAPRVHNSGHWTQDGATHCQFENHVRAVCNLPLGGTEALGFSTMINVLGTLPDVEAILDLPDAHLHLYDKSPRPGRKLGHVNVQSLDEDQVRRTVAAVFNAMGRSGEKSEFGTPSHPSHGVVPTT